MISVDNEKNQTPDCSNSPFSEENILSHRMYWLKNMSHHMRKQGLLLEKCIFLFLYILEVMLLNSVS